MTVNKENKSIDPLFDGHLEKSAKEMTPTERLELLWQLVEFRLIVTNRLKSQPASGRQTLEKSND